MRLRADVVRNQVDAVRQLDRIDGMDEVEELERGTDLVGLEMSDQVPARTRHARGLLPGRLLDLVLADDRKAVLPRLADDVLAVRLGDGDDLDLGRIASGLRTGRGDLGLHLVQDNRKFPHSKILT